MPPSSGDKIILELFSEVMTYTQEKNTRRTKKWCEGLSLFLQKLSKKCEGNFTQMEQDLKMAYLGCEKGYKLLTRTI